MSVTDGPHEAVAVEYRQLGTTCIRASALCLGVAFRGHPARGRTEADCAATIERAVELGINFIDCANVYGRGWREDLLGRTVKRLGNRHELVITTKVGQEMGDAPSERGLSRGHILQEIDNSLRRLRLDYVDIYLMHQADTTVPLEESLQAMDDVVRQGKARHVGVSNHDAAEVVELLWAAERERFARPAMLQYQYSLLHRWHTETDIIPLCERHGLGLMTYSPVAIGLLTGQVRAGRRIPAGNYWHGRADAGRVLGYAEPIIAVLVDVARELGKTPAQVAVAWLLANPAVSAPILGPDRPEHVDELVGAVGWRLPPESKAALDEVSAGGGPFEMNRGGLRGMRRRAPGSGAR